VYLTTAWVVVAVVVACRAGESAEGICCVIEKNKAIAMKLCSKVSTLHVAEAGIVPVKELQTALELPVSQGHPYHEMHQM